MRRKPLLILPLFFVLFFCKNDQSNSVEVQGYLNANSLTSEVSVSATTDLETSYFLSLSDVHLESGKGNTTFGRHNDTGDSLWSRTKNKIEEIVKTYNPKFMVYLGDLPHHQDATRVKNVTQMLENLRALDIDIPLLYLPGNNDALGGDYNSFQDRQGKNPFSVDPNSSDPWPVLHHNASTTKITGMDFNKQFGYYSTDVSVGTDTLKVIALNSVIFTNSYYRSDDNVTQQQAAQKQFKWLEDTLDDLPNTSSVLIMMHIPPGYDNYSNSHLMWNSWDIIVDKSGDSLHFQNAFLKILDSNKTKVKGILTSHTHFDGIRRLYNSKSAEDNTLVGISISTPGITIGHGNNPGFKLFKYENSTFDLMDFETFYAKPTYNDGVFKFLGDSYTFKGTYEVSDPQSTIYDVISQMDSSNLKAYMSKIIAVNSYKTKKIVRSYNFYDAMKVVIDQ